MVYSTRLHVYTRASLTDILARILARKSARVGQVGGQVGEDVRVGVVVGVMSVPWNSSFINAAIWLVYGVRPRDHVADAVIELHWLCMLRLREFC